MMKRIVYVTLLGILASKGIAAQDIAQWRGPDRTGIYPDSDLLDSWPETGPEQLWSMEGIGKGYSSVSVMYRTVYATGLIDSLECLTATQGLLRGW